jgi:hypothetical protein
MVRNGVLLGRIFERIVGTFEDRKPNGTILKGPCAGKPRGEKKMYGSRTAK